MELDIFGFKAKVTREGKYFIGEIEELHVADQAKTLKELEDELKDAVDLVVKFILANPKNEKSFGAAVVKRLKVNLVHA